MPTLPEHLLSGPLVETGAWPLTLTAVLGDLRPRFIAKGRVGRGWRAIARNGRILLASDRPLEELAGRPAHVRLQTWHRAILPGDRPEPYGVLLCVRSVVSPGAAPPYRARLLRSHEEPCDLALEVGGGMTLQFQQGRATQLPGNESDL